MVQFGCKTTQTGLVDAIAPPFTDRQEAMIMQGDSGDPMRVYLITNRQDSILLRTPSEDVFIEPGDPVLKRLTERMYTTVTDSMSLGAGIAAPQVGILKNVIWVQRFDKPEFPFEVYINPKIVQYSTKKFPCVEGCLSIPDRREKLESRSYAILLEYADLSGNKHVEMVEDFTSVIFQHEVDHLNGILYIDHLQKELEAASKQP